MVSAIGSPDQKRIVDVTTRADGKNALEVNMSADIEIGAVEIKDATTDTRAVVKNDGTDNALVVTQNSVPTTTVTATDFDIRDLSSMQDSVSVSTPNGDSAMDETYDVVLTGVKGSVAYDNTNDLFKNLVYGLDVDGSATNPFSSILTDWGQMINWSYDRGMPMLAQDSSFNYWFPLVSDINSGALYTNLVDTYSNQLSLGYMDGGTAFNWTTYGLPIYTVGDSNDVMSPIIADANTGAVLIQPIDTNGVKQVFDANGYVIEKNLTDVRSDNSIAVSSARYSLQSYFESASGWSEDTDSTDNLATTTTHRGVGNNYLTFDKISNTDTDARICRAVTSFDMSEYNMHSTGTMQVYLPDLVDVVSIYVRMGTDSSNYHYWTFPLADLQNGWNSLNIPIVEASGQVGVGMDLSAITYICFGVTFGNTTDTLAGIITGGWGIKRVMDIYQVATVVTDVNVPNINLTKIASKPVSTNTGNAGTGTQRVVLATDQPVIPISDNGGSLTIDGSVTNLSSDNQIGGVLINGGDGAKNDTSLTLTAQSTAYSNTAPATPHLLIVHNASDTDVYLRFTTGTTLGTLLASGKSMSIDMGASEVLYFYCPTAAGKIINYSTRSNY